MEDIELVIKINKHIANAIINGKNDEPRWVVRGFQATIADAIKNGTPLPKGHGDLVDRDEFLTVTDIRKDGSEVTYVLYDEIANAQTIIEADKEVGENEQIR